MEILVTGGSGFIGSYILRKLASTEHAVRALLRDGSSDRLVVDADNIRPVSGDIRKPSSLDEAMNGCDAVIHLVGIIEEVPSRGVTFETIHREGTRHVVQAAVSAGVRTFVHMSANGAGPDGVSRYQTTKWEAEKIVESAGFERWTIFRPSIVFGRPDPGRPEFATKLVRELIRPFPILPIFGDGKYLLQPVAVESLAEAMVSAMDRSFRDPIFVPAGPEALPYVEILDRLTVAVGLQPKLKIHIPVLVASAGIAALGWTGLLPITSDQLDMLLEDNVGDFERFHDVFGLEPIPFSVENLSYLG